MKISAVTSSPTDPPASIKQVDPASLLILSGFILAGNREVGSSSRNNREVN